MEELKKQKTRIVKFFTIVSIVALIFAFSVMSVSANVGVGYETEIYYCGIPWDVSYYLVEDYSVEREYLYTGVINKANSFVYSSDGTPVWYNTNDVNLPSGDRPVEVSSSYRDPEASGVDVIFTFPALSSITGLYSDADCYGKNIATLNSRYGGNITVPSPTGDALNVIYYYALANKTLDGGRVGYEYTYVSKTVTLYPNANGYISIPYFNADVLTEDIFTQYGIFDVYNEKSIWICESIISLGDIVYLDAPTLGFSSINPRTAQEYRLQSIEIPFSAFSTPVTDLDVNFDELSWTDWIVNSVGGFMNFEIVPGLSFAGMLAIIFGIPLLLWFLKLFAGG